MVWVPEQTGGSDIESEGGEMEGLFSCAQGALPALEDY